MSKPTYGEMRTRAERVYDEEVKKSVLAGLEALQDLYGDEWVEKIDCAKLDLRSSAQCVLGQVCGYFETGLEEITDHDDDRWAWAEGHGFFTPDGERAWDRLDAAWHDILCDGGAK